ncbi:MAG: hypothetical protein ACK4MQ_07370 [Hyphomonas sp.]
MDIKRAARRAAVRINTDEAETLTRLAAGLTRLEAPADGPDGEESDMAHALRTRRMLRRPLSTAR